MIYKAGEAITFVAFYTADGRAKPSLSVSASVHRIGYGIVDNPDVSEDPDANGFYYCNYAPLNDGAYVCIFKTTESTVDQKHIAGIAFRGVAGVNNLPTAEEIDNELTSAHGTGSWKSYAVNALLLRLEEDELHVLLSGQAIKPISLFRGDSMTVDITVIDADENPIDLTDATAKFTAREREDDEEQVLTKDLNIYDAASGKMKLELSSSDTELEPDAYPADIEITFPDARVKTVWKSMLEVKWDVSR